MSSTAIMNMGFIAELGDKFCGNNFVLNISKSFNAWSYATLPRELMRYFHIQKEDKDIISEFKDCFSDLIELGKILHEEFQLEQIELKPYYDIETKNTYLTVNVPLDDDNPKESFEKYDMVKNLWLDKINPKTLKKVFIDLVC